MCDEERTFLDAVLTDPADDTVRLVYADFLEERGREGDADRAMFIRAQIFGSRTPTCGRQPEWNNCGCGYCKETREWRKIDQELYALQSHELRKGIRWLQSYRSVLRPKRYRDEGEREKVRIPTVKLNLVRGFVGVVTCSFGLFRVLARKVFEVHPVTEVLLDPPVYHRQPVGVMMEGKKAWDAALRELGRRQADYDRRLREEVGGRYHHHEWYPVTYPPRPTFTGEMAGLVSHALVDYGRKRAGLPALYT